MEQAFLWLLLLTLVLFLTAPSVGDAQVPVVTNITSTPGAGDLGTIVTSNGNLHDITGGTRPGGGFNLFHSFGDFSIGQGDIANFLNDSGLATSNIIGRVTGGNPSNIDGLIRTSGFDIGDLHANLFLVNPAGIVFGPQGSFDVTGSVSFSTAQYLRLFDSLNGTSANFYADPANDSLDNSVLAVAPAVDFGFLSPAAYGFLTAPDPNATITIQGSALSVFPGQSISLVGGNVVVQGASLPDGSVQHTQLSVPNGRVLLASTASPGEFDSTTLFAGSNVESVSFASYATASLEAGSSINVSGETTGFFIKGGQLGISVNDATLNTSGNTAQPNLISLSPGSVIWTQNSGSDSGADVDLVASNIQMAGAFILSQTDGAGRGGDITMKAGRVTIEQGSGVFTGVGGTGVGGDVVIEGADGAGSPSVSVVLSGGSQVASSTNGSGASGGIFITAKSLDMNGSSAINSSSFSGIGLNGDIVVAVQEARLSNGSTVENSTVGGEIEGGKITVQGLQGQGSKADSLVLEGQNTGIKSGVVSSGIEVHARMLSMTDQAVIQVGSPLSLATPGDILIDANSVSIAGGSFISSQAFGFDAGSVTIMTDQFSLDHSLIETKTASPIGGQGGNVVLKAGSASLTNGATINSSSTGTGNAGNVTITASGAFTSDASTIATSAENAKGGDISIDAQNVQLSNGTLISASSNAPLLPDGAGNAGNITINSDSNIFMQNSSVTTEASQASGGQVTFTAPDMIQLIDSNISTSVAGSATDTVGGNVNIDPQFVILQNSQIIARAFAGSGGAIDIIATSAFITDPSSIIDASSTLGISGTVNIDSPLQNVGGELTVLTQEFSSAAALLPQQCAARVADGKFSTFVIAAREGLPAEPGGFLASPSLTSELLGARLSGQNPQIQFPAVTGLFPQYDPKPIQVAKLGSACR
jgi:filamentous hemagglutinin family protein